VSARSVRPDPDGHHDDLDPVQAGRLSALIPDNAAELDADRLSWLMERAHRSQPRPSPDPAARVTGLPGAAGWWGGDADHQPLPARGGSARRTRWAVVAGLLALAVLVTSGLGATLALLQPGSPSLAMAAPLADPTTPVGAVGGLLPAVELVTAAGSVSSRQLRPAVMALVPTDCPDCAAILSTVAGQATLAGRALVLVGRPSQHSQLVSLQAGLAGSAVIVADDQNVAIAAGLGRDPADLTVLVVAADGTVGQIVDRPDQAVTLSLPTGAVTAAGPSRVTSTTAR
jgi:hypothetical protein